MMKKIHISILGTIVIFVTVYVVYTFLYSDSVSVLPEEPMQPSSEKTAPAEKLWDSRLFFDKSNIAIAMKHAPPANASVQIDPHYEWISFGALPEAVILLPLFWDISSTMEDDSFLAEIAFPFDQAQVEQLGGDVSELRIYVYNRESSSWEAIQSHVDEADKRVHVQVATFSRYALGFSSIEN